MIDYSIKENSWIARLAALKLRSKGVAIVIGKTIHLHHTSKQQFLKDERWVKHELCHIRQFQQNGFIPFMIKYLWESIKKGYYNNKYEVEAREAEGS
ncbi:MAG TPA: hypothetical protein VMY77_05070 [Chitinophagaceae bacterium]|nr:hypothetical protein [Chitinophagaceae bacterium]